MIKKIAHVCLRASDLQETEDFYCRILGMEKFFSFFADNKEIGFYLKVGGESFVEIFAEEAKEETNPHIRHFCLEVDDIDKMITEIREKGWKISDKSRARAGNWQCWIRDPNGVRVELQEYTLECSQKTGKDCISR